MPVPLHTHTHYSALDGVSKPEEIVARVKDINFDSCGITDHNFVSGHIDFYKTLVDNDLKPILGIETYQAPKTRLYNSGFRKDPDTKEKADEFHLILLAINNTGLKNLWAINSEAHKSGFYYTARVDWSLLKEYNEGIIATSACGLGMLQQAMRLNSYVESPESVLQRYLDIFGDRFYVEVSTYPEDWQKEANLAVIDLAREYGVPLVYGNDAHYAFPSQAELHEMMLCMQYQEKWKDFEKNPHHQPDLYIMDEEDIITHLDYLPGSTIMECMNNSDKIAKSSTVSLPEFHRHIPVFIADKKYKNSAEMFFELAKEGYEKKIVEKGKETKEYLDRFELEVKTIFDANLIDYFLTVRDYINWAKDQGIAVGPGRGSIGGSLIAFLIGITEVDPIRYGLLFERFYNSAREKSMPDIDTDFSLKGRDQVKEYVTKKYGEKYVSEISNHLKIQGRKAINALGTTLGVPISDVRAICRIIESNIESGLQPSWTDIWFKSGNKLQPYKQKYPKLFEKAQELYERIFSYGVHASGVLISDVPLGENFPLRWNAKEKKLVTQFDYRTAESMGFMKCDFLALRNLDTCEEVNRILIEQGSQPIDYEGLQDIEYDEEMWKLLESGFSVGIFQIEEGADAKRIVRDIKPRSIEDLALCIAINRPGPLKAGSDKTIIAGRNGDAPYLYENTVSSLGKHVADATKETFGKFVFEEQVTDYFKRVGFSPDEAETIRHIIHKKLPKEMMKQKNRHHKLYEDKIMAEKVWREIENFSKYGFNKSHAISYAIILLRTLYAKWKVVEIFQLAGLRTVEKDHKAKWVKETQRMGIPVLPPDINKSEIFSTVSKEGIRYGLFDVKNIGRGPAKWIIENRPFKDFDDLLAKSLEPERKITLANGGRMVGIKSNQIEVLQKLMENEGEELLEAQEEYLGIAISDNSDKILGEYKKEIEDECTPFVDIIEPGFYTIAGVVRGIRKVKTSTGKDMAWVTIEQDGESRDIAVWSNELVKLQFIWKHRTAVVANIKVNDRGMSLVSAKVLYGKEKEKS